MQVELMKPILTAPGTNRLNLKCDDLLSTSAFNSNLCRYAEAAVAATVLEDEMARSTAVADNLRAELTAAIAAASSVFDVNAGG